jgi:hypothetical protein
LGSKVSIPRGGLGTNGCKSAILQELAVAIPHGGLGTWERISFKDWVMRSPSHPMGLKHLPKSLKIQALTLSKLKQPTGKAH